MRSIRRPLAIGTVLCALVALPALFARPWADERFVMYMPEKLVGGNPFLLVRQVISETSAWTVEAGVFRPVSRLGFYLDHWLVVRTGIATGLAPNVVMSVVKVGAVALLLATGLLTVNQYRRAAGDRITWHRIVLLLPVVFAGSLVLVNPAVHPLTLFPGLYLGTAFVALLTPLWPGGLLLEGASPSGWRRWGRYGLAAVLGAVFASMIELAWLAIPLALVHLTLLARHRFNRRWLTELSRSFAARLWAAMSLGFAVVFIPVRVIIANSCAAGACYQAATPRLGGDFFAILPFRIGSAFVPVGLIARFRVLQRGLVRHSWDLVFALGVAVLAVAVLVIGWRAIQDGQPRGDRDGRLAVRAVVPLATYYSAVILLASVLAATSSGLQDKGLNPAPWRETGFGWIAWAVLIALVLAVALEQLRGRPWLMIGVALVALAVSATTLVDREDMRRVGRDPEGMLHVAAGWQLVDFDPADNASRCETIDGLREVAASDSERRKMGLVAEYLDATATNNFGMVFCDDSS